MATLVLTVVGGAIGGPIGAAIGAFVGQQVDNALFAPTRRGPRLGDLSVQVSRYGQPIPKLFGTMRVAGTVIWATDLREDRHKSGGGKGKPKTTTYSYSASFAVALSGRTIRSVRRIWAEGKLLRGAGGDWKSETGGFRLYTGGEGQDVDPLIASAEGAGGTPAFRGIAYVVFEDLQLADFGNRIPSLTFEVEADAGSVSLTAIAAVLSDGAVGGTTTTTLGGYAALGDSVRSAIEALDGAAALSIADDGATLVVRDAPGTVAVIDGGDLGTGSEGRRIDRVEIERRATGLLPDEVAIGYYEPARDYQSGLQRARRAGPGHRVEQVDLAAALAAGEAKAIAERRLAEIWQARSTATVRLPWRSMGLRPGQTLSVGGLGGSWRIAGLTIEKMVAELKLVATGAAVAGLPPASAGRATGAADVAHGATSLVVLDLPPLDEIAATAPTIWIAAAGSATGWRRAALSLSTDGGASYPAMGDTAAPATMGVAVGALTAGEALLFDRRATIEVELLGDAMTLTGCSDAALVAGTNLAMIGDELIQFGDAVQIGVRRYVLSRLLRGRRGTEWAMAGHGAGERFVLIEAPALATQTLPASAVGATAQVIARGVGDAPAGVAASGIVTAQALRPPHPVRLTAKRLGDGTVRFAWTRRSRTGWAWSDGGDAPLGEEREAYRVTITPSAGAPRIAEPVAPSFDYTPALQAADGAAATTGFALAVSQIGSLAPSRAASASFTL